MRIHRQHEGRSKTTRRATLARLDVIAPEVAEAIRKSCHNGFASIEMRALNSASQQLIWRWTVTHIPALASLLRCPELAEIKAHFKAGIALRCADVYRMVRHATASTESAASAPQTRSFMTTEGMLAPTAPPPETARLP